MDSDPLYTNDMFGTTQNSSRCANNVHIYCTEPFCPFYRCLQSVHFVITSSVTYHYNSMESYDLAEENNPPQHSGLTAVMVRFGEKLHIHLFDPLIVTDG